MENSRSLTLEQWVQLTDTSITRLEQKVELLEKLLFAYLADKFGPNVNSVLKDSGIDVGEATNDNGNVYLTPRKKRANKFSEVRAKATKLGAESLHDSEVVAAYSDEVSAGSDANKSNADKGSTNKAPKKGKRDHLAFVWKKQRESWQNLFIAYKRCKFDELPQNEKEASTTRPKDTETLSGPWSLKAVTRQEWNNLEKKYGKT